MKPTSTQSSILQTARQRAFTLIELLVVILIIGILIAVAAPSFLGHRDKARDLDAQQTVMVAVKAAQGVYFGSESGWPSESTTREEMKATEPHLSFREFVASNYASFSTGPSDVSVSLEDNDTTLRVCAKSITERVYCAAWSPDATLTVIPGPTYTASGSSFLGANSAQAASRSSDSGTVRVTGANELYARGALPRPSSAGTRDGIHADLHFSSRIKPVGLAPQSVVAPVTAGQPYVGYRVSGHDGAFSGSNVETARNWQVCASEVSGCSDIPGANETQLVVPDDAVGSFLRLRVVGSDDNGEAEAHSPRLGPIGKQCDDLADGYVQCAIAAVRDSMRVCFAYTMDLGNCRSASNLGQIGCPVGAPNDSTAPWRCWPGRSSVRLLDSEGKLTNTVNVPVGLGAGRVSIASSSPWGATISMLDRTGQRTYSLALNAVADTETASCTGAIETSNTRACAGATWAVPAYAGPRLPNTGNLDAWLTQALDTVRVSMEKCYAAYAYSGYDYPNLGSPSSGGSACNTQAVLRASYDLPSTITLHKDSLNTNTTVPLTVSFGTTPVSGNMHVRITQSGSDLYGRYTLTATTPDGMGTGSLHTRTLNTGLALNAQPCQVVPANQGFFGSASGSSCNAGVWTYAPSVPVMTAAPFDMQMKADVKAFRAALEACKVAKGAYNNAGCATTSLSAYGFPASKLDMTGSGMAPGVLNKTASTATTYTVTGRSRSGTTYTLTNASTTTGTCVAAAPLWGQAASGHCTNGVWQIP